MKTSSRPDRADDPAAPSPSGRRSATYIGADWMIIVDACAAYRRSAAIAPCLLLAEPGQALRVLCGRSQLPLESAAIAHGADLVSEGLGEAGGNLYLHFEPLSPASRALAALAGSPAQARGWRLPAAVSWTPAWFDQLVAGTAASTDVIAWVESVRRTLVPAAEGRAVRDGDRVAVVARALVDDPSGRLDCAALAATVHCSAHYLRRVFRETCGMSMSRYQAWCRLDLAIRLASDVRPRARGGSVTAILHEAGFYDAPHGYKALRQYFGVDPACVLLPARNCAQAG
jgi:AraC-like DNA-binding protein